MNVQWIRYFIWLYFSTLIWYFEDCRYIEDIVVQTIKKLEISFVCSVRERFQNFQILDSKIVNLEFACSGANLEKVWSKAVNHSGNKQTKREEICAIKYEADRYIWVGKERFKTSIIFDSVCSNCSLKKINKFRLFCAFAFFCLPRHLKWFASTQILH